MQSVARIALSFGPAARYRLIKCAKRRPLQHKAAAAAAFASARSAKPERKRLRANSRPAGRPARRAVPSGRPSAEGCRAGLLPCLQAQAFEGDLAPDLSLRPARSRASDKRPVDQPAGIWERANGNRCAFAARQRPLFAAPGSLQLTTTTTTATTTSFAAKRLRCADWGGHLGRPPGPLVPSRRPTRVSAGRPFCAEAAIGSAFIGGLLAAR